jgi:tripartite-type tricarboxylate transporter receptor subunit TctC
MLHRFRVLFALVVTVISNAAAAQDYPARPITLLVPWSAGGPTDIAVRALGDALSRQINQRVLIENRPGSGGAMAAQQMAATARPDGYTLAQLPLGVFRLPFMVKTSFDPLNDLTWIANIAGYDFGVSVRADSPLKTWNDLVAFARAHPGKLAYSSPGVGTSLHLTMDDLMARLQLSWLHVPYKGSADAVTALLGGHVDAQAGTPPWEMVAAGKVRTLVMWGHERNPRVPAVPTLKELYGIVANSPWGIGAPKNLDPAAAKVLHEAIRRAVDDPAFLKALDRVGMSRYYMAGDEYAKWIRQTYEEERRAVEKLGLGIKQ